MDDRQTRQTTHENTYDKDLRKHQSPYERTIGERQKLLNSKDYVILSNCYKRLNNRV